MNRTQINQTARRRIATIAEQKGITRCEAKLPGCMGEAHAPAHRHKRIWYYDKADNRLSDFDQWIGCCQNCHTRMEKDARLTETIFVEVRGIEG